MQRIKKQILFLLALAMILCLFAGCDQTQRLEALTGSWYTVRSVDAETIESVLLQIDLYEPELALIKEPTLSYCQKAEFRADQTYTFSCDAAASQPFFRSFFLDVFQQLFEGRDALSELYGQDFQSMSQDAFFSYYAQLYMQEDFEALLDYLTADAVLIGDELMESGSFTLRSEELICTDEAGKVKAIRYLTEESGALVLTYHNGSERYTREIPTP